jgi:hypothetical protein
MASSAEPSVHLIDWTVVVVNQTGCWRVRMGKFVLEPLLVGAPITKRVSRERSAVFGVARGGMVNRNPRARRRRQTRHDSGPRFGWYGHSKEENLYREPSQASRERVRPPPLTISDRNITPR